jgi:hypothetical protein
MQPDDKDAALLPRRIDGLYALIHRPMHDAGSHVWISYSSDLRHWGGHKLMLAARKGGWWDANKVGLSPPLIETPRGWLMLYHGVRHTAAGCLYRLGLALFDLEHPEQLSRPRRLVDLRPRRVVRTERRCRQRDISRADTRSAPTATRSGSTTARRTRALRWRRPASRAAELARRARILNGRRERTRTVDEAIGSFARASRSSIIGLLENTSKSYRLSSVCRTACGSADR